MKRTLDILKRRQQAIESTEQPFTVENPAIKNPDSIPTTLTTTENEILAILLYFKKPMSVNSILAFYIKFKRSVAFQLYMQVKNKESNRDFLSFLKQDHAFLDNKFKFNTETIERFYYRILEYEKLLSKEKILLFRDNIWNPKFLDKIAEGVLGIRIPTYRKIYKDILNLRFLSFVFERSDASQKTTLYYLNPEFFTRWNERRTELITKLRNKTIDYKSVFDELIAFYQLYVEIKQPLKMDISDFRIPHGILNYLSVQNFTLNK